MGYWESVKAAIPENWVWFHSHSELIVAVVVFAFVVPTLILQWNAVLNLCRPACRKLHKSSCSRIKFSCRWTRTRLAAFSTSRILEFQRTNNRWNVFRLKKGWRPMQANLSHVVDELRRATDLQIRKSCVAIKLNGIASQLTDQGQFQNPGLSLIWYINNVDDKNMMVNAYARDPERYIRFLAALASAMVDEWDDRYPNERSEELDEDERSREHERQAEWLREFEIPHKILMDYVGDALGFEGEWIEGRD